MSASHTPTPWLLDEDCSDEDIVEITSQDRLDNSMCEIATVETGGFNEEIEAQQRANAAFIVRAVNCHADLVAALKHAEPWVESGPSGSWRDGVMAEIRAALAKAEAKSC